MVIPVAALLAGMASCGPCHPAIAESYARTAHFRTSSRAGPETIRGSFEAGHNLLRTRDPEIYFRMERRGDSFYQVAEDHGTTRAERFDLVMGSGRRGQTYLYLKNRILYQLPVSYSVLAAGWVNSPGYVDGKVYFDREIQPSCMECHSTLAGTQLLPGITCRKCHGMGAQKHADLRNPARLDREAKIAVCAACHSGLDSDPKAEVHGNQVGLLRRSRCFQNSPAMSCLNCHHVHRLERDLAVLSAGCLGCHARAQCKQAAAAGNCIDCHMPRQESQVITFRTAGNKVLAQTYRTHQIGIYGAPARHE
jgi:hypothetical protein